MKRYAELVARPHVTRLLVGMVVSRLPFGINAVAIVLYVQGLTGSFADAGLVAGALALGAGAGAPVRGRLSDRVGARRVLLSSALAHAGSLGILVGAGESGLGALVLALPALSAGFFTPPTNAVLRRLWPSLVGSELLTSAYALDSVLIELVFVIGPLITGLLAAVAAPELALGVSAVSVLAGTLLFVSAAPMRVPHEPPRRRPGRLGALAAPGIRTLALSMFPVGICFGSMEVGLPAFAAAEGDAAVGGVLLAVWSAGSAVGGLVYGARAHVSSLDAVHLRLALVLPFGFLAPVLAPNAWVMALLIIPSGLAIAPLIASRNELVGRVAPPGTETEAFTWPTTSMVGGIAVGSALAGAVSEHAGWEQAILAGAAAAFAGAAIAYVRRGTLVRATSPPGSAGPSGPARA